MSAPAKAMARVAQAADLRVVRFHTVDARLRPPSEKYAEETRRLDLRNALSVVGTVQGSRFLAVILELDLLAVMDHGQYDIHLALEMTYNLADRTLTREDCREFVEINVPQNAWPYLREAVQAMSARLGVREPFVLPLRRPGRVDMAKEDPGEVPVKRARKKKAPAKTSRKGRSGA